MLRSDQACVTFRSCDGRSIEINKYFLFLYDAFYRNILDANMEESLVFIFEGVSFDELIVMKDKILQKHLQCVDHSQISAENPKIDIEECNSQSDPSPDSINDEPGVSGNKNLDDDMILECPFKCEDIPETKWTFDLLFAHIFTKHDIEVKNNFFVSIDTFIERLTSQLSSVKICAFNCKKGYVYSDLTALKMHYYRCHREETVICTNCGDSFRNSMTYKSHTRDCHVLKKECDLCGGMAFKYIRLHMKHYHREKKIKCQVDGCSRSFTETQDLKKHTRIVHLKEKPFPCDICGTKMAQFINLKDHRIKVHKEHNLTYKEYKEMIRSGKHQFLPKDSELPKYM